LELKITSSTTAECAKVHHASYAKSLGTKVTPVRSIGRPLDPRYKANHSSSVKQAAIFLNSLRELIWSNVSSETTGLNDKQIK